jgi:GNAT superfamily N-acetyltransferase
VTVKKQDELQGHARGAMSFTVRRLVPADLDALADTFAAAPYAKERAQYERYVAEHEAGSLVTLVARALAGTVVGYVNLLWDSDYSRFAAADIPEINDLNVIIPWRRRGVGTALITAAEAVARDAGRRRVGIGVGMTPDYDAARRLYPALGYLPDGFGPRPTAYGDAEYLTKELPPSAPESR